jgi:hypothetical protein
MADNHIRDGGVWLPMVSHFQGSGTGRGYLPGDHCTYCCSSVLLAQKGPPVGDPFCGSSVRYRAFLGDYWVSG